MSPSLRLQSTNGGEKPMKRSNWPNGRLDMKRVMNVSN